MRRKNGKLTSHLHCYGKRPGKGLTSQRNLSCPVCCHKTASVLTPDQQKNTLATNGGIQLICTEKIEKKTSDQTRRNETSWKGKTRKEENMTHEKRGEKSWEEMRMRRDKKQDKKQWDEIRDETNQEKKKRLKIGNQDKQHRQRQTDTEKWEKKRRQKG